MPSFKIMQGEYLAASKFKTNKTLTGDFHDKAVQNTIDAIGRMSSEGDALMRIEDKGNVIREISINNTQNDFELSVGMLPQNELQWDPGYCNIEWTPHNLEFNWQVEHKPSITVKPHSVRIYMRQWPSIDISVETNETQYGNDIGKKIDKKI